MACSVDENRSWELEITSINRHTIELRSQTAKEYLTLEDEEKACSHDEDETSSKLIHKTTELGKKKRDFNFKKLESFD